MPTEKPRVTFMISEEKLAELESYRFDNKIKNQSQAILSLIDKGLSALEAEKATDTKNSPSTAEAVPEENILAIFNSLRAGLISMGLIRDGEDITEQQAQVLISVCRILDAVFKQ